MDLIRLVDRLQAELQMQQDAGQDVRAVMNSDAMPFGAFDQLPRSVKRFEFGAKNIPSALPPRVIRWLP